MTELPEGINMHGRRFRASLRVKGKLVRESFASLEAAIAFRRELLRRVRNEREQEIVRVTRVYTIGDVVREWWEGPSTAPESTRRGHRDRVSLRTRGDYQYLIDKPVRGIADESAQEFARNPGLLKMFYDSLPKVQAWRVHAILRQAFEAAVTRGIMDANPANVKAYHPQRTKRGRKAKLVPPREHVETLVAAAYEEDSLWGLFVSTLATLGLRCGEICALRWEHFHFEKREVEICQAVCTPKGGAQPTLKEPKAGEPRTLPVGEAFWNELQPFRRASGLVFPNTYSRSAEPQLWHPNEATRRFRRLRARAGLPAYTPHSLRHFVATQLLIEGQPINQVAEFLGHTPAMTLNLYGRTLDLAALRRVGDAATKLYSREIVRDDKSTVSELSAVYV